MALYNLTFGFFAAISMWSVSTPFTYFDNRMLVDCTINGHGPFHMIVDTGSPTITVTPETAKRLGVPVRDAGQVSGAGNKSIEMGNAKLQTVAIGGLTFRNVSSDVIDLSEIRQKFHFPYLDGIIGYPVLKDYDTFVNVDTGTISFSKTLPTLPANATKTTFQGVLPVIHARIDGIPTSVLVDSGDRSSATLFGPFARKHAFYDRFPSKKNIITGYGIGGAIYADVFTLPSLDVFDTRLGNVVTRASRQTGGGFASSALGGSIGTGVLRRFNIVYDYRHDLIVAWPSKLFRIPDAFKPPG